ncbi:MAG TPA: adenine deaminase [Puia sp.]|nr:adenine deaminase [Puia sp.]
MNVRIKTNVVDILSEKIYAAQIIIENARIQSIEPLSDSSSLMAGDFLSAFLLPGFIDAHVHIESSMLIPSEFARLAVVHGTVATVSDPHEIANVCGVHGVDYMIENSLTVPFKFFFGAPSCVPATIFETAGAELDASAVESLLKRKEIKYLSEMMNFPGVLNKDQEVMKKIQAAHRQHKPVDGHAPGLRGLQAKKYIEAGISTDHECFTSGEALDKLQYGMKIIIREGSAAKNFEALIGLLNEHPDDMMFCSDDKHPDSLVAGHINQLCARAIAKGIDLFKVLKAACINPVLHYHLDIGLLRKNDPADFIIVKDLRNFEVMQTWIDGNLVAENGRTRIPFQKKDILSPINNFNCKNKVPHDFNYPAPASVHGNLLSVPVIEALDGQLITNKCNENIKIKNGNLESSPSQDILKIVVANRYRDAPVAKAFIKNFGLREGALASSVAHDSHNIVSVGVDDESICKAINLVIEKKGGISCVSNQDQQVLALPVAGLMSNEDGYQVAAAYTAIDGMAKKIGSTLSAPFMTLSFMALLVIPHLKLSDLGLFDGDEFKFIQETIDNK